MIIQTPTLVVAKSAIIPQGLPILFCGEGVAGGSDDFVGDRGVAVGMEEGRV